MVCQERKLHGTFGELLKIYFYSNRLASFLYWINTIRYDSKYLLYSNADIQFKAISPNITNSPSSKQYLAQERLNSTPKDLLLWKWPLSGNPNVTSIFTSMQFQDSEQHSEFQAASSGCYQASTCAAYGRKLVGQCQETFLWERKPSSAVITRASFTPRLAAYGVRRKAYGIAA